MPQELESMAVFSPARRTRRSRSSMGSLSTVAANIRSSSPAAVTGPPSRRTIWAASICSNSSLLHSPRSSPWIGLSAPSTS